MKKRAMNNKPWIRIRNDEGTALALVLCMSIVITLWIFGISQMIIPTYQKMTMARARVAARAGAEAALDFACAQLNYITTGQTSKVAAGFADDATIDGVPVPTSWSTGYVVPAAYLNDSTMSGTIQVYAMVWVNNVAPPTPTSTPPTPTAAISSILYKSADCPAGNPLLQKQYGNNWNAWREVTATCVAGGYTRTIRAVLMPSISNDNPFTAAVTTSGSVVQKGSGANSNPIGSYTGPTSGSTPTTTAGGGSVASLNTTSTASPIKLAGTVGNVYYFGLPGSTPSVSGGTITGILYTTDSLPVAMTGEPYSASTSSNGVVGQYGSGKIAPYPPVVNDPTKNAYSIVTNGGLDPVSGLTWTANPPNLTIPPVPKDAVPLPSNYDNGSPVTPGDYTTTNLSISKMMPGGNTSVDASTVGSTINAVNIWVTGGSMNITGGGDLIHYGANRLNIYYAGSSGGCTLSGNNSFCGNVLAPNLGSPTGPSYGLTLNGNGNFFGSAVFGSATMHGSGSSGGVFYDNATGTSAPGPPVIQRWTAVSWQEL